MRRTAHWCVLILVLPLLAGCYVSRPARLSSLTPGQQFNLVLSDAGLDRVTSVSTTTSRELRGQLLSLTPDSVTFSTRLHGPTYAGANFDNLRQPFTIARNDIDQVTVPELHTARTGLVVAAAVVVGVTIIAAILKFAGVSATDDPPGDPSTPFFAH